jgi:hypothetical protein
MKFEDLMGQRFNRLAVVSRVTKIDRRTRWTCRWSRHSSLTSARRAFRETVNNRQGVYRAGALVELPDVDADAIAILGREETRS